MVIEFLLNGAFSILEMLLSALPSIQWDINTGVLDTFLDFIDVILYIFPFTTVIAIIGIVISVNVFKIVISMIKTLWSLIPFI